MVSQGECEMKSIGNHKVLLKNGTIRSSRRKLLLRLPEETYQKVRDISVITNTSINAVIVEFLQEIT